MKLPVQHTVMIVTDDQHLAAIWWSLAQHCGYEVKLRAPAATLRDELLQDGSEIVVVDLDAAHYDGLAIINAVRGASGELEVPWVIAMKATVSDADVDAAMSAGVNELVPKAGNSDAFLEKLQSADRVLHRCGTA